MSATTLTHALPQPLTAIMDAGTRAVTGLVRGLAWCYDASIQRRRLAELPDHRLVDLGISRTEAEAEASRPFWSR
jgi:hypothetical protein